MAITNFDTINGQILAETASGVTKNYVVDALGSVTGVSQGGSISGAARYSPYGRTIAGSSGAVGGWVWSWGYYPTGRALTSHHVRARHFDKTAATWTTVDPIPLSTYGDIYRYARVNPLTFRDPTGWLSITGIVGPTYQACGGARVTYKWDGWKGLGDGWIVQHIENFYTAKDCWTDETKLPSKPCKPASYWEAWMVQSNRLYLFSLGTKTDVTDRAWHDEWALEIVPCSYDKQSKKGTANFLPGSNLQGEWSFPGNKDHNPCAKDLPTRNSSPPNWIDAGASIRTLTVKFGCCQACVKGVWVNTDCPPGSYVADPTVTFP